MASAEGMEPGDLVPGDMEPGGMEPGGVEPGSLEPGSLEPVPAESLAAAPNGAGDPPSSLSEPVPGPPLGDGDASLLGLIDRLSALLDRSDLTELEVEAGGTGLVLRKPAAIAPPPVAGSAAPGSAMSVGVQSLAPPEAPARPSVKAPLTGLFYTSPAPGSAPYVTVGSEIAVGTVIGLIEAMKLFNEIKSDLAGRVVRVVAESGALVKAKQPLIEVEPL